VNILDRHILGKFVRLSLLAQSAFTGIYLLIDFFEKIDDFLEYNASVFSCILYFLNKVPLVIFQTLPIALLLAAFLTLGGFARTGELTAMRAGGLSLSRIASPLFLCGLLISLGVLFCNETLLPHQNRKINRIMNRDIKQMPQELLKAENLWLREGSRIIHIGLADPLGTGLNDVSIFEFDSQFRLRGRIEAGGAYYSESRWIAPELIARTFAEDGGTLLENNILKDAPLPLSYSAEAFREAGPKAEEMGFFQLRRLTRKLQNEGYDAQRYRVDLHSRLSTPFANLIMVLLAVPFSLARGRGSSLATGVGISIAIGLGYHMLQALVLAFGYSGALPPPAAAWTPNLIFLLLGIWLIQGTRQ